MAEETDSGKHEDKARERANENERIKMLRERLYARGKTPEIRERHGLGNQGARAVGNEQPYQASSTDHSPDSVSVAHDRTSFAQNERTSPYSPRAGSAASMPLSTITTPDSMSSKKPSRSYRLKFAIAGIIFFVGALAVSSGFLFLGNNTISGDNITLGVSGPLTIGGGEDLMLQVAIANQNTLPIESATLIITYPKGTQSVSEIGKEIFSDRQQLNNIGTGEVINVPLKVRIFGEENEEKVINVSVEYRVAGSNATFYKEAAPFSIKVSTSPVVLKIDTVKSISSGQEATIELTIQSNSPTTLSNLLVKASYPTGFDFSGSKPETVSGQDTWKIASLKPGEKQTITIRGILVGSENSAERFLFSVGVPNERDTFNLASLLTTASNEILIEKPFLDVEVKVNGDSSETTSISSKDFATVDVSFKNVLDNVVYDGIITVALSGNALNEGGVDVKNGYYDSSKNTITWDSVSVKELKEIEPGTTNNVSFILKPRTDVSESPEIKFKVSVQGQRIFEDRVPEAIAGTVERTIKIESLTTLTSSALYSEGPFVNTGPTPPVAEKTTQYTYLLTVTNGTNAVSGAEVTAIIPQYITWLDLVSDNDTVTYNATTRTMKWNIGDIASKGHEEVWIQVSFAPSLTQVGKTPTILETQRLKATDRFTGALVRTEAPALTTALRDDPNPDVRDGRVVKK